MGNIFSKLFRSQKDHKEALNATETVQIGGGAAQSQSTIESVPVLIIGGGPTGLLLSHLLSELKVKNLVVERYPQRLGAPKAHALSPRSLEVCRQANLDTRKIRKLGTQRRDAYYVNFITNLSGEKVGVLPYERMDREVLDVTPEMIHNIPQPNFEQFVTDNLQQSKFSEIRKPVSFVSIDPKSSTEVITTVEDRKTGRHYQIQSQYVVACDGAKSRVRTFLNIESEGEESYDTMMTIHFNANLRPVLGDRVGMLHWVMDPEVSGFIIGYDLSDNQVLICNFDAKKFPVENWDEAHCRDVVDKAIGQKISYDILGFRPWMLSRKVAKQYQVGNIFLAGDSAHSFPPTGGLGLNSGLGDVHNIAYKLAGVLQGWAKDSILKTYEEDRRMVALINSQQSVKNGLRIFGLLKTLGTAGLEDPAEARKNLLKTIHDPSKQDQIQEQIKEQTEHFDNLELHIGYVYGSKTIPPNASDYTAKYTVGAVFPHTWITIPALSSYRIPSPIDVSYVSEFSSSDVSLRQYSTLDLFVLNQFTIIASSQAEWQARITSFTSSLNSEIPIQVFYHNKDFSIAETTQRSSWLEASKLDNGAAYLVRPDQHILGVFDEQTISIDITNLLMAHLGQ